MQCIRFPVNGSFMSLFFGRVNAQFLADFQVSFSSLSCFLERYLSNSFCILVTQNIRPLLTNRKNVIGTDFLFILFINHMRKKCLFFLLFFLITMFRENLRPFLCKYLEDTVKSIFDTFSIFCTLHYEFITFPQNHLYWLKWSHFQCR